MSEPIESEPLPVEPIPVQPMPVAPLPPPYSSFPSDSLGYSSGYNLGRPGIITAIGVISIVVGSFSILASGVLGMWNFGMLMFAGVSNTVVTTTTPTVVGSGGGAVQVSGTVVSNDRGLSAADRKTVMVGLSHARPVNEARRRQLEELLAENGQDVISLSGPALTAERVGANVSSSGMMPTARGDDGADFFVLGTGRVELSEDHATFVPSNGEPAVRVSAVARTEDETNNDNAPAVATAQGTVVPLTAANIQSVLRRIKQIGGKLNAAQTQTLLQTLRNPGEQLIVATAGGGDPASQVASASTMADGSVYLQARHGNTWSMIMFDPAGQITQSTTTTTSAGGATLSSSSSGAMTPHVAIVWPAVALAGSGVNLGAAVLLLVGGIFTLRQSRRAATLHWIYAWVKIPAAIVTAIAMVMLWRAVFGSLGAGASTGWWLYMPVAPALVGLIYPIALMIALRSRTVRAYYTGETDG